MAKSKLISAVKAIIKPANIGDTARYIEDGSGVAHPVEDQEARQGLETKVDKEDGKLLSTNDFDDVYKKKLDGIEEGATKNATVIVDDSLKADSSNPVQNQAIFREFNKKMNVCYGTCSTAGDAIVKTVECPEFALVKGAMIFVSFDNNNTAGDEIKLDVNSTGAKWISDRIDIPDEEHVIDGPYITVKGVLFIYDGDMYRIVSDKHEFKRLATIYTNGLMSAEDKKKLDSIDTTPKNIVYVKAADTPEEFITYVNDTGAKLCTTLSDALYASNQNFAEIVMLPGNHDIGYIDVRPSGSAGQNIAFKNLSIRGFDALQARLCVLKTTQTDTNQALRLYADNIALIDLNLQFDNKPFGIDIKADSTLLKNVYLKWGGNNRGIEQRGSKSSGGNVEISDCFFENNGDVDFDRNIIGPQCALELNAGNYKQSFVVKVYGNTGIGNNILHFGINEYKDLDSNDKKYLSYIPATNIIYSNTNLILLNEEE